MGLLYFYPLMEAKGCSPKGSSHIGLLKAWSQVLFLKPWNQIWYITLIGRHWVLTATAIPTTTQPLRFSWAERTHCTLRLTLLSGVYSPYEMLRNCPCFLLVEKTIKPGHFMVSFLFVCVCLERVFCFCVGTWSTLCFLGHVLKLAIMQILV